MNDETLRRTLQDYNQHQKEHRMLITGNGFDLALGLPTSYSDFIQAARVVKSTSDGVVNLQDLFPEKFNTLNTYYSLQESYDLGSFKKCEKNAWLQYFLWLNKQEKTSKSEKKWVDFEREIRQILEDVAHLKQEIERYETNTKSKHGMIHRGSRNSSPTYVSIHEDAFDRLGQILAWDTSATDSNVRLDRGKYKQPNAILQYLYEELEKFSEVFKSYLQDLVIPIFDAKKFKELTIEPPAHVITFNYTPIATILGFQCEHLHGSINDSVIFGVDSADDLAESLGPYALSFTKYFQCLFHQTFATNFKQNNQHQSSLNRYYFYGHSFDLSDRSYIKVIFDSLDKIFGQKAVIYYHSEESRASILRNLLDSRMLGEDAQKKIEALVASKRLVFEFKPSILPALS